jgi:hypothetical protein
MPGRKGEAGESPALSRNCNSVVRLVFLGNLPPDRSGSQVARHYLARDHLAKRGAEIMAFTRWTQSGPSGLSLLLSLQKARYDRGFLPVPVASNNLRDASERPSPT